MWDGQGKIPNEFLFCVVQKDEVSYIFARVSSPNIMVVVMQIKYFWHIPYIVLQRDRIGVVLYGTVICCVISRPIHFGYGFIDVVYGVIFV